MPSMRRRTVLAALGTLSVPLAGCSEATDSEPSPSNGDAGDLTRTSTATAFPDTTERTAVRLSPGESLTSGNLELTITAPQVRKMVVYRASAHDQLLVEDGTQYLLVSVVSPDDLSGWMRNSLGLVLDGKRRATAEDLVYPLAGPSGGRQDIAFPVPVEAVESAAVLWKGRERDVYWELGADTRRALAREPVFEGSMDVTMTDDGTVELHAEISNTGDRRGLWLGKVSYAGHAGGTFLSVAVPAGRTATRTFAPAILDGFTGEATVTVRSTGGLSVRSTVEPTAGTPTPDDA